MKYVDDSMNDSATIVLHTLRGTPGGEQIEVTAITIIFRENTVDSLLPSNIIGIIVSRMPSAVPAPSPASRAQHLDSFLQGGLP